MFSKDNLLAFESVTIFSYGKPYLHIGHADEDHLEVRLYWADGAHDDVSYEDAVQYIALQYPGMSFIREDMRSWDKRIA